MCTRPGRAAASARNVPTPLTTCTDHVLDDGTGEASRAEPAASARKEVHPLDHQHRPCH